MRKISQARKHAREANRRKRGSDKTLVAMDAEMDALGLGFGTGIEPLMPTNLNFQTLFQSFWSGKKQSAAQYKHARELVTASEFLGTVIYLKDCFFNDGFNFGETDNAKLKGWLKKQRYDFGRVVNDAWQEWLTCDNIVAFWCETDDDTLPVVSILDCEICDYRNAFGVEILKIKVPKVTLKSGDIEKLKAKGLDQRYIDAIKDGKELTIDEENGEHFRVLTRAKLGKGLGKPRLVSAVQRLSTLELFGVGDFAAASQMKRVVRQVTKGHDIRAGQLTGQPNYFMTTKNAQQIKSMLRNKDGAFDAITNFDVKFLFPFIDPKYFDDKKMAGTIQRLENWAGPLSIVLRDGQISPYAMDAFGTEGRRNRQLVGDFLTGIFTDESFLGKNTPPADLIPRWNPCSFTPLKLLLEILRLGQPNGLISPQTAREWMMLDDEFESKRMKKANKDKGSYTPPFEAKQGMLKGGNPQGGRPAENPVNPA